MSSVTELAYVEVYIIPKGAKFNEDDYNYLSRSVEDDEFNPAWDEKKDVVEGDQYHFRIRNVECTHLAKEELFAFEITPVGGVGINNGAYCCLGGEIEAIGSDLVENFYDDFIKIAREKIAEYKASYERASKDAFFMKEKNPEVLNEAEINLVTFIGKFRGVFSYDSYSGESESDWDFEGEIKI